LNLSVKSKPVIINAYISGPEITEGMQNSIRWDIEDGADKIDILPPDRRGRQVQVSVKNNAAYGEAAIKVWHGSVDEGYWKTVKILLSELNNNLTLMPERALKITNGQPQTVEAFIPGGNTADYNEIKWLLMPQQRWDGTMFEVARVMGSGKQITIYPINDGTTSLFVYYNGKSYTRKNDAGGDEAGIEITVENEYYFDFKTGTEYMFPGERREIEYEVRPVSSNVVWVANGGTDHAAGPVFVYGDIAGSQTSGNNKTAVRKLLIEAKREGTDILVGMANGRVGRVTVMVSYNYSLRIDPVNRGADGGIPAPYYKKSAGETGTADYDGKSSVDYYIWPPNAFIKCVDVLPAGLEMEIGPPDAGGKGTIRYTSVAEQFKKLKFKLYKAKNLPVDPDVAAPEVSDKETTVQYAFPNVQPLISFVNGDGQWSRFDKNQNGQGDWIKNGITWTYNGTLVIGDGEEHYLLIKSNYSTAAMEINKDSNDSINLISTVNGKLWYPQIYDQTDVNGTFKDKVSQISAKKIDLSVNGAKQPAVQVSGGNDYIVYDRVKYDKELFLYVASPYPKDKDFSQIDVELEHESNLYFKTIYKNTYKDCEGITHPYSYTEYDYFYIVKPDMINEIGMTDKLHHELLPHIQYVKETVWLSDYHSDDNARYYLPSNILDYAPFATNNTKRAEAVASLAACCDKVRINRPAFRYSYELYYNNKMYWDYYQERVIYSNVAYDQNGLPVSGYFDSNNYYIDDKVSYTYLIRLYKYDRQKLRQDKYEYNSENEDQDEIFENILNNMKPGMYIPSMWNNYTNTSTSRYFYSSILYTIKCDDVDINPEQEYVSKYNVFNDKIVSTDTGDEISFESASSYIRTPRIMSDFQNTHLNYKSWANDPLNRRENEVLDMLSLLETFWTRYFLYSNINTNYPTLNSAGDHKNSNPTWKGFHLSYKKESKSRIAVVEKKQTGPNTYTNVTVYKDFLKTPHSINGYNIFARNNYTGLGVADQAIKYGDYGAHYYYSYMGADWSGGHVEKYNPQYSSVVYAKQMLKWERSKINRDVIIPYYFFNQFPYRFVFHENYKSFFQSLYGNMDYVNIVKLSHENGKPMPSVSTEAINIENTTNYIPANLTFVITLHNTTGNEESNTITINIPVRYEIRPCHMNFRGINDQLNSKYTYLPGRVHYNGLGVKANWDIDYNQEVYEYEGAHSNFGELQKFVYPEPYSPTNTNNLKSNDPRRITYDKMADFLK